MALADYPALVDAMANPTQRIPVHKVTAIGGGLAHWNSSWISGGNPLAGAAPGAASVPTRATTGAIAQNNKLGTEQRAWFRRLAVGGATSTSMFGMSVMLIDRLSHLSGLDGTSIIAQPAVTSALTRYASDERVCAAVEIYTAIGATATTLTASYTNQAGTPGRTSLPIDIGGAAGKSPAGSFLPISLQAGDKGVQAVASVTLAATTGTVGNFGVTLYKVLGVWPCIAGLGFPGNGDPLKFFGMANAPVIEDDACLSLVVFAVGSVTSSNGFELDFFED